MISAAKPTKWVDFLPPPTFLLWLSVRYDLSRTCDEIRPNYWHNETCMQTVPEAITAFLEGNTFEDVIRTAVSLGGDCDTLAAIAASIAEAFYGVPDALKEECHMRLSDDLNNVLNRFFKLLRDTTITK